MKGRIATISIAILALVMGIAQSLTAQTFKKVKVALNAPLVQVASGGASVWALASNGNPYIFKGKSFALANTISLTQIAVGGGNAAQADAVWGLNSSGNIYRASKSGTTWIFTQVPGVLSLIAVGPGSRDSCHPYEVWGLNSSAQIYRYDFCGNNFVQVSGILCDLKVGGDIWGAQCGPNVFRFNFSTLAFDQISDPFLAFPMLAVGPNGMWAVDTAESGFFTYDGLTGRFFGRQGSLTLAQIQAGGNGVWGINSGGSIFRLEPSTLLFDQVPGSLTSISVGSGGGVWGIDGSHRVLAFSTP